MENYGNFNLQMEDVELHVIEFFDDSVLLKELFEPFHVNGNCATATAATEVAGSNDDNRPAPALRAANPSSKRFPEFSEGDLDHLLAESGSKATEKMTKWGVTLFKNWLTQRDISADFESLPCARLDEVLRKFYAEIRNADGNTYGKSTFVGIRAAISRHLKSPPHNKPFALMGNPDFHKSNQMFSAMLKLMKKEGLDKTTHYQPITENDMKTLKNSSILSSENPKSLQRKVWFDITLNFARRGRENLRSLTKASFVFHHDESDVEYCQMAYNESTKNHKGDNLKDNDSSINPRMYSNKEETCPVKSLKLYLSKLAPGSNHFFQQPKRLVSNEEQWYTSRPVGERVLNEMMKTISVEAGLSKVYTNHCVRATAITRLAHAGVETREIMKISGHRNEASVRSYNADSSENQKRQYSLILQGQSQDENIPHPQVSLQNPNTSVDFHSRNVPFARPLGLSSYSSNTSSNQSILNMPPVPYGKQFEINNSVVHVHNYYGN